MTENKNIDIFISTANIDFHDYPLNNTYKIITDKNSLKNKYTLDIIEEDTKYNNLLKTINEFTRMYYVYKNISLKKYIGFCSYRRYFEWYDNIPDIDNIFKYCDVLTMQLVKVNPLYLYKALHNIGDYYIIRLIIMNLYNLDINDILKYEKYLIYSNIWIMYSDMFYKYCDFVSSVLDEYIKFMNFMTYDDVVKHVSSNWELYKHSGSTILYLSRLLGFLVERITSIFFHMNFKNICFNKIIMKNDDIYNKKHEYY